jgi:hypothetical protein
VKKILLFTCVFLLTLSSIAQAPVVFKLSEGVRPGGIISLYGEYMTGLVKVKFVETGSIVTPVQQDPYGQYIRIVMPDIPPGAYTLQISNNNGSTWSNLVALNKPEPRWLSETTGYPKMKMKLLGRNFLACQYNSSGSTALQLIPIEGGPAIVVPIISMSPYALSFTLPSGIEPGNYFVEVRMNLEGRRASWIRHSETLNVISAPTDSIALALGVSWARDYNWNLISNVKTDYGAKGDGITDDTPNIQNAIDNVALNGGGIVYFPNGIYMHKGITIKQGVILRGESKLNTIIKFNGSGSSSPDGADAVIKSTGTGTIGITNLTLTADLTRVTAQTTKLMWFNFDSKLFLYNIITDFPKASTQSEFKDFGWCGSMSNGKFLVSGCTMKGTAFYTPHITQTMFINNTIDISFSEISAWGNRSIFEGNHISGSAVNTATQHGFFIDIGAGSVKNLYYNNNLVDNMNSFMNQGEAFSTDGLGTFAEGPVTAESDNSVTITQAYSSKSWTNSCQIMIVKGKGMGQKRNIIKHSITGSSISVIISKDWDVQPDASSKCLIGDFVENLVVENLTVNDCKVGFQFFCNSYDNIFTNNSLINSQGILIWSWTLNHQQMVNYYSDIRNNLVRGVSRDENTSYIGIRDESDKTLNDYAVNVYGVEYRDNIIDRQYLGEGTIRGKWVCMAFGYNNGAVMTGKGISALLLENNAMSNFFGGIYISPAVNGVAERASKFTGIEANIYSDEGSNNIRLTGKPDSVNCNIINSIEKPYDYKNKFLVYPNPIIYNSIICYQLAVNAQVQISISDFSGKDIVLILNEKQNIGEHQIQINASEFKSGIYLVKLNINGEYWTEKIVISK